MSKKAFPIKNKKSENSNFKMFKNCFCGKTAVRGIILSVIIIMY